MIDIITKYFPHISEEQRRQFEMLEPLYSEWNEKINVISRKDIENLMEHHVLHSLSIARFITPVDGTGFMDLGTGGGFPGIPLAIIWPDCQFHLIDRIGKKIRVAQSVAEAIGLKNVTFQHGDSGECHERFDYVVSRAVMTLDRLTPLIRRNISQTDRNRLPNGLLCLKGGDLEEEIAQSRVPTIDVPLSDFFEEEYFATKHLIYAEL